MTLMVEKINKYCKGKKAKVMYLSTPLRYVVGTEV
jgi:hypothetical protein